MLHFPSSSHPSPHALVVVLSKKLMNAKLFWLRWRGCSIKQTLVSMPLPLAYFFGLDIPWQQTCFLIFGCITYLFTQGLLWNGTCSNQSATYSPLFPTRCTKAVELAQKKLEPLHGLLHYQSLSMDLFSTKEHFMMQYAYATDGGLLYYHHSVFVAGISQQNMHWAVTIKS